MNSERISNKGQLRISWFDKSVEGLGPGKRMVLWVQGCNKRCHGCIAERLQDIKGGELIETAKLAQMILEQDILELSISGGEPFLQSEELECLLKIIKSNKPDMGIIVYTGYCYEDIINSEDRQGSLKYIDILVDGEYVEGLDDGHAMRGSSNQRVIFLSNRYSELDLPTQRINRIEFTDNGYRMIGIPSDAARVLIKYLNHYKMESVE